RVHDGAAVVTTSDMPRRDPMETFDHAAAMQDWSRRQQARGATIGLVPTMGALHDGHLALMREAAKRCDVVVTSIFVNPLQFNRLDDFDSYPRTFDADLRLCREHGVDAVYAPTATTMYPPGFETQVEPGHLAETLEGAGRPGHFRGVTTVVTKLFNAVHPNVALFGLKDFQQLAIIRRMVIDLDMGIEVVGIATVRELGGLAMSSRNGRLNEHQRAASVVVPLSLDAVEAAIARGNEDVTSIREAAAAVIASEPLARLEYCELVDPQTLVPVTGTHRPILATIAVWFGDVRLIDNRVVADDGTAPEHR
ncbi:MAG: pantoate--beta-alanine ligase, partial [Ilumatobacteraceae bacterium]